MNAVRNVFSNRRHAVALDVGADMVRMWLPHDGLTVFETTVSAPWTAAVRSDATAAIVKASRQAIRRRLPRLTRRRPGGFRVAATVPACADRSARRRLEDALHELNRDQPVLLMETPLAAAAGAGVDTASMLPRVVLDVGVHGSEAAVIAQGRVLDAVACSHGCRDIEQATAAIVRSVRRLTDRATAVLNRDPLEHGVLLVGGGALVPQLARALRVQLGTAVHVPNDPRNVAARGVGLLLAEADRFPRLWVE